jgi:allantoinase
MAMGVDYITYPKRGLGMDQDRYPYREFRKAPALKLPNNAKLALFVTVPVEWYPMDASNKPFAPIGGLLRPYPDSQGYTARDYGNRVGIYRMMNAFASAGIKPTALLNSRVAKRYPILLKAILEEGWEIMASGTDMAHLIHSELTAEEETAIITESLETLRSMTGQKIEGWHSPEFSESHRTPELLAANGIKYFADFVNDEKPYDFRVDSGTLTAIPGAYELADRKIIHQHFNTLADFEEQVMAAFTFLYGDATPEDGRIMTLSVTPWLMGQPYRIAALERLLNTIMSHSDVIALQAGEIAALHEAQR